LLLGGDYFWAFSVEKACISFFKDKFNDKFKMISSIQIQNRTFNLFSLVLSPLLGILISATQKMIKLGFHVVIFFVSQFTPIVLEKYYQPLQTILLLKTV
jgi:hypothetical protein